MKKRYDVAIAGSGYAGSLMAMVARRLGLSVVLLERGKHPRVVIGESSTPLSNLLLESLAETYDLPTLRPLTKWGTWQKAYPEFGCGLKRGFTFFHHQLYGGAEASRDRELLVAASPSDAIADTHWFRADVDRFLVQQACALGADFLDRCEVQSVRRDSAEWTLQCRQPDAETTLGAGFLIDATGPRGLLHRAFGLGEKALPGLPRTSALYSHFTGVKDFALSPPNGLPQHPYPANQAAVHHVFDGGWIWVLQFNNGWTSAGVAARDRIAEQLRFGEGSDAWKRLLQALPEVREQFSQATSQTPFTHVEQLPFRSSVLAGPGWAMLPSAAGFVDPLLSTGFPLTLLGVHRVGEILARFWGSAELDGSFYRYARETEAELLITAELIGALYAHMGDFAMFRTLSLLYFAAASFSETVWRLGKPQLVKGFLLQDDAVFGPELRRLCHRAQARMNTEERLALQRDVYLLIERFDVAGLCKERDGSCYPVCAEDLFAAAHKVQATPGEIEAMLERSGFYGTGDHCAAAEDPVKVNSRDEMMPLPS